MGSAYLVAAPAELKRLILASDRAFFAVPVLVEMLYSEVSTRFVFVRDGRGRVYPVRPRSLRAFCQLSRRQQGAI